MWKYPILPSVNDWTHHFRSLFAVIIGASFARQWMEMANICTTGAYTKVFYTQLARVGRDAGPGLKMAFTWLQGLSKLEAVLSETRGRLGVICRIAIL